MKTDERSNRRDAMVEKIDLSKWYTAKEAAEKLAEGWPVPLILRSRFVKPAPPIFFTEILEGELAMPTGCGAKVRVVGVTERAGAAIPVPLSETV